MMSLVKHAKVGYAHLPPWARSWAASAYGYLLRPRTTDVLRPASMPGP